jgi:alkanesulfonate monooxygenase SsuD/methylene tetrahydromethanopterin reductase-like flavin-dependent oxidoreductase (luciferase family)
VLSAARLGLPALSSFFVPVPELQRRHTLYRETALAAGRAEPEIAALERRGWGMRVVHVARQHDEALRATEAPFMGYQRRMAVLRSDATGGSVPSSFDRSLLRLRAFEDYLADGWAIVGTPDEVRDGLEQYLEATGYERVLLLMALPGLPTELALRSMRLFAEEVAPKLERAR